MTERKFNILWEQHKKFSSQNQSENKPSQANQQEVFIDQLGI